MNRPTELAATATAAEVAPSSHATTAGGAEPGAATAAPPAANAAAAAAPQPSSSSSKWHAYYASDPTSAPWDTHAASSQLRSYLCGCCSGAPAGASSSPAPGVAGPAPATQALSDALLHVCDRCAGTKPPALVAWLAVAAAAQGSGGPAGALDGIAGQAPPLQAMQPQQRQPQPPQPPRVLELCCGTGGSLAYMRSLGFHVVGVELVQAACGVAAERLAAASAPTSDTAMAASGPGGSGSGSGRSSSGLVVVEAVHVADRGAAEGCAVGGCGSPGNNVVEVPAAEAPASTSAARLLHGDLFAAAASGQIVPQSFDFMYDCQGLHAMPAELRPAYAGVMARALRPGGIALVLVGRREEDDEVMAVGAATAGVTAVAAAANGSEPTQGAASAKPASRPGPSLMSLSELRQLFPADHGCGQEAGAAGGSSSSLEEGRWQWLGCSATGFDLTNAYRQLPAAPPAWCLLLRRC
ncbi:hypothetical protein CHLRE_12g544650v5 [Chlamydomonas reinhardtii]|uniref:Methyltransferase type 11 domain-containing protein n=1 Tax=Chlamydomonas reinhardtii TaxID=3055 RepID=A0A2K3D6M2_CHLRE|nr:uncharacterized protein CHLRE_12g544650v5 [Chlamydomonas reinhardtii]PNW76180.1 hypothetical protein CHLRE_12g544650v5 [Chlamydomonas reinhardtii]